MSTRFFIWLNYIGINQHKCLLIGIAMSTMYWCSCPSWLLFLSIRRRGSVVANPPQQRKTAMWSRVHHPVWADVFLSKLPSALRIPGMWPHSSSSCWIFASAQSSYGKSFGGPISASPFIIVLLGACSTSHAQLLIRILLVWPDHQLSAGDIGQIRWMDILMI